MAEPAFAEKVCDLAMCKCNAAAPGCSTPQHGSLHKLRRTFCSHLAMRGAPAKAIQELAGHENLMTTLRYMHLSPSARKSAISLLNTRVEEEDFGEIVETGEKSTLSS
jgi:integrase